MYHFAIFQSAENSAMYLDITNAHDQLISKDEYVTTKVIKDAKSPPCY